MESCNLYVLGLAAEFGANPVAHFCGGVVGVSKGEDFTRQGVASIEDIDVAMKGGCGFPMGPFALLDLVGLDTSLAILDALYAEFRDPNYAAVPLLRRMVSAELFGRKSGQGFYDYRK